MPDGISFVQTPKSAHIKYYPELIQGSDEWLQVRCGLLTASEMKLIITPTLKIASNEKERAHLYELLAQRVNNYVEPHYISDDMLRGQEDEVEARLLYAKTYAPVDQMGFITNDKWNFTLGFSPDGLVGEEGFIECKSRRQKYQFETIIENVAGQTIPVDFLIQEQTGHLVSERGWCDFISYSGGMPMATIRVYPDPKVGNAIIEASGEFERRLSEKLQRYQEILKSNARLIPTERRVYEDIVI
jgi:hypothetical protein